LQALQRSDILEKYFKEKVFVEKVQIVDTIFKESIASPTANSVSITLI